MIAFKYNIQSRGTEGNDNTWEVIPDIETPERKIFVDHIEFLVNVETKEKFGDFIELGFCMFCDGEIELRQHPSEAGKQFMVIKPKEV